MGNRKDALQRSGLVSFVRARWQGLGYTLWFVPGLLAAALAAAGAPAQEAESERTMTRA